MYITLLIIEFIAISENYPGENMFKVHVLRTYTSMRELHIQYNVFMGVFSEVYSKYIS